MNSSQFQSIEKAGTALSHEVFEKYNLLTLLQVTEFIEYGHLLSLRPGRSFCHGSQTALKECLVSGSGPSAKCILGKWGWHVELGSAFKARSSLVAR
eukprot:5503617-Amphidinium_carterae.1